MRTKHYTELIIIAALLIIITLYSSKFLLIWAIIEIILFFFVYYCLRDSSSTLSIESVSVFFVYKTLSGIIILVGLSCDVQLFILLGIIVSLNLFPFLFWFIRAFYYLAPYLIVRGGLYIKIIPLWIINRPTFNLKTGIIYLSILTRVGGSLIILSSFSLGSLLITSRVYNSQMFILSTVIFNPILFLISYYLVRYGVLYSFHPNSLWMLRALPPSPLFFLKIYILYYMIAMDITLAVVIISTIFISYFTYVKFIIKSLIDYFL